MLRLSNLKPLGLDPVSLVLEDGACLVVTGPSGSGKSLFLRAIADLDENEGEAETGSKTRSIVSGPAWRRSVVYVPTESGWWGDSVGEHLSDTGRSLSLLADVGLDRACVDWPVARLSTGEKQRLALVRALLLSPDVLLLDEPTSALDEEATVLVERLLGQARTDGCTLVMVTHDDAQAARLHARHATVCDGAVFVSAAEHAP